MVKSTPPQYGKKSANFCDAKNAVYAVSRREEGEGAGGMYFSADLP